MLLFWFLFFLIMCLQSLRIQEEINSSMTEKDLIIKETIHNFSFKNNYEIKK